MISDVDNLAIFEVRGKLLYSSTFQSGSWIQVGFEATLRRKYSTRPIMEVSELVQGPCELQLASKYVVCKSDCRKLQINS